MTDIEIAHLCKPKPVKDIFNDADFLECFGKYKAKIDLNVINGKKRKGKLILVTSINPTPYGEGKTTMSIGIYDAFKKLKKNALLCLREPSLGPVFGIKGGATGGGKAQVVPMEDINLHFTGDIHAITSANNLLCAAIDNHIFQGNKLNIDKVTFNRCMDVNDRALRNVTVKTSRTSRGDSFNITAASEVMAILCLSKNLEDLKRRLGNIIVGFNIDNKPVYAKDLKIENAMTILLKDAIKPNLVQTLENNPVIIHGGPFANIAHGCNSIIATDLALRLSDYVITEAGFGADLGAEKFLDVKCRSYDFKPDAIMINVTIRSLKYDIDNKDKSDINRGLKHLKIHIENMKKYLDNVHVCLNKFDDDLEEDISIVRRACEEMDVTFTLCDAYSKGSDGALETAKCLIDSLDKNYKFNYLYDIDDSIEEKIEKVIKKMYRAKEVYYTDNSIDKIKYLEKNKLDKYPIVIAKTPYVLGVDKIMTVKDIKLNSGAEFITVYLDDIMTMPGLSKNPAYINMHIDKNGNIEGIF